MELKNALADYTEAEFTTLIQAIKECEGSEEWQNDLIAHLNSLAAGAGGSDLIFYPEPGADTSARGIVQTIQGWCIASGKAGFRSS